MYYSERGVFTKREEKKDGAWKMEDGISRIENRE
jgi:hypothetical protein